MKRSTDIVDAITAEDRVIWAESVDKLDQLSDTGTDGVIWRRTMPEVATHWLDDLPADRLPLGRLALKPEQVSAGIQSLFARAGNDQTPGSDWMAKDAAQFAAIVHRLSAKPWLRLRLEPVSDNACSKFHIDHVDARLICTYRGPGTELTTEDQGQSPAHILTVPTGMPILFKGRTWPGAGPLLLRHRSPPIAGTDTTRLLLVMEGLSDQDRLESQYDEVFTA